MYHKCWSYGVWLLRYQAWQNFLLFWAIFCPLTLLTIQKIKILKKQKKPGDIIILHLCTANVDHMMYGSWDIKCDRQNFLSFWASFFLPFYRPNNPENQNFEKNEKRLGDIIILHMSTMNQNHMMYDSWDTARNRNFSHFGPFFVLLAPTPSFPLLTTQRIKILKKWKKTLEILFYTNVP